MRIPFSRAKKHKFPDGYPGDAPSSNPNKPIKYACHKCNKNFPPVPNPLSPEGIAWKEKGETIECERCKHPLCGDCKRAKPVKVEPAVDEDVLERVRVKLAGLGVGSGS
jgi:DNA-directed RNA polymerase subunit RPC12/RpoP